MLTLRLGVEGRAGEMDRRAPPTRQQCSHLLVWGRQQGPACLWAFRTEVLGHPGGRADRSLQPAPGAQRDLGAISPGGRGLVPVVGPALRSVLGTEDTKCLLSGWRA